LPQEAFFIGIFAAAFYGADIFDRFGMGIFATSRTGGVNGAPAIGARAHPGGTTWVPMRFCFAGAEAGTGREAPGAT
jgi:hypothetical protein